MDTAGREHWEVKMEVKMHRLGRRKAVKLASEGHWVDQLHPPPGAGQCEKSYVFGSRIVKMFHSNSFYILYVANSSAERGSKGQALITGRVWKGSEKAVCRMGERDWPEGNMSELLAVLRPPVSGIRYL